MHHVAGSRSITYSDTNFNILQRVVHASEHVQSWKMHIVSVVLLLKTHDSISQQALLPVLTDSLTDFSSQQRVLLTILLKRFLYGAGWVPSQSHQAAAQE